jgi:hypothetical protein
LRQTSDDWSTEQWSDLFFIQHLQPSQSTGIFLAACWHFQFNDLVAQDLAVLWNGSVLLYDPLSGLVLLPGHEKDALLVQRQNSSKSI